ncbi:hypothetical protein ACQ7CU_17100 [Chryseobacterium arthrosphaerae]|uniref:hypothetical protein n=1 Tax=Chryseobacterium arthrosphaerae TaxID=651561 RepID=UPI003D3381B3
MKKFLQVALACTMLFCFAQNKEIIKLKGNIPNNSKNEYKGLTVIDQRKDKTIGVLPFDDSKEMREITFETSPDEDLGSWYRRSNFKGGKKELVLVLNELKLSVKESSDHKNLGILRFSAQTFSKEGMQYQFLYKKDTTFVFSHKNVSDIMVKNIHHVLSGFLSLTYQKEPHKDILSAGEVSDYEAHIKNTYAVFRNESLKDGIYLDYISFFKQIPEEGSVLEKNEFMGTVTRGTTEKNGKVKKISTRKIFAYVENGKAYKILNDKLVDLNRNDNGFYLLARPKDVFQKGIDPVFAMFGIAGVLADALATEVFSNDTVKEIYIDPLTGEYDLSDENLNKLIQ